MSIPEILKRVHAVFWVASVALVIAVVALVIGLYAQPSSSSQGKHRTAAVASHPCAGKTYHMQCAVEAPGQILTITPNVAAVFIRSGLDFAWGGPAGSFMAAHGMWFGASYLSGSSKDWSYGLSRSYVNAKRGVVFVWETSAARSLDGYRAGYDDAYNATHEANRLGFKHGHIDFASDFDSSPYGYAFVSYYEGAAAWDRRAGFTTGAYGGLHTVTVLCAKGITTANWQTLAWSYGVWASSKCAPLRQTAINDHWYGYSIDYDSALAAYYGQSNYSSAPLRPVCFGKRAVGSATCRREHALVRSLETRRAGQLKAHATNHRISTARRCPVLSQRVHWYESQLKHHPRIRTVARRRALHASRVAYRQRKCSTWQHRDAYFAGAAARTDAQINHVIKLYS